MENKFSGERKALIDITDYWHGIIRYQLDIWNMSIDLQVVQKGERQAFLTYS